MIGKDYKIRYNASGNPPTVEQLKSWIEELINSGINTAHNLATAAVLSNYPNPFNNRTQLHFKLADRQEVRLSVYDSWGSLVKELLNREMSAGDHAVSFEADNLTAGLYFCRLQIAGNVTSHKIVLLK